MIRVRTPSRLHFGLLAPAAGEGRRFGSVGLMVEAPGIELSVEGANAWAVEGPLLLRTHAVLRQLTPVREGKDWLPLKVRVHHAAPEHRGLGTGTQHALALARALAEAYGWQTRSACDLAPLVGRGNRSALGIHGFEQGGFLVDGGRQREGDIAPLIARMSFPDEWRVVLVVPPWKEGLHGEKEVEAFRWAEHSAAEQECSAHRTETLARLLVLGLLPALAERDFGEFSNSLFEFNRVAGEAFAPVQGGSYASSKVAELIAFIRSLDVKGVGQTSWGPTVFALAPDEDRASWLAEQVRERFPMPPRPEVIVTAASNQGARLWKE